LYKPYTAGILKGGDIMFRGVVLLGLFLIGGCTSVRHLPPELCTPVPKIDPPMPAPVTLSSPEFYVVSNENEASFLVRIEKDSNGVFYAISPGGYTVLAQNMQELRRYIRELQQVVVYYKNYDKSFNDTKAGASEGNSVK